MTPSRSVWTATLVATALGCHDDPVPPGHPGPARETGSTEETEGSAVDTGSSGHTGITPGISGFALDVDPALPLLLHATFTDPGGSDAWVEYRFEGDEWLVAPTIARGEAVVLGIPELTPVEARAAAVVGGTTVYSRIGSQTTGPLPPFVLRPVNSVRDAALMSPEGYALVSLATGNSTFEDPYVVEIFDRSGRVVWFHQVPDGLVSLYPSVARDGRHLWFDAENIFHLASGTPHLTELTLDGRWRIDLPVPDAGQAFGEGPDDSYFYEVRSARHGVARIDSTGAVEQVWDCDRFLRSIGRSPAECLLNTTNWDEGRGTVLASQFETSTVFEVEVATGEVLRQFGELQEGAPYAFDPPEAGFAYQHWPHWTPEGTLMVSTHVTCGGGPGCTSTGLVGTQVAAEYAVDDVTSTLTRIWSHESTDVWATQAGEAYRLPNGNLIQGYGQDGVVREYAPGGQVAWQVAWPRDSGGYRLVGHLSLVSDLYALNQGH